jgi:gliding motility-associated lipoprotein GldH
MKKIPHLLVILILVIVSGCSKNNDYVVYHKFKDQTWPRFNILQFEIPVNSTGKIYDISLFVSHSKEYEFDDLDFNMVMTTPSGEERIKEYHMNIKRKDGRFAGQCYKDSCEVSVALKRELNLTKGILTLEIESLVPRLEIKGLLGIGIRLHPVR